MNSILLPLAVGYVMFLITMRFFKMSTSIILGVISFLITYAYIFFNLPDIHIIIVLTLVFVLIVAVLIKINLHK